MYTRTHKHDRYSPHGQRHQMSSLRTIRHPKLEEDGVEIQQFSNASGHASPSSRHVSPPVQSGPVLAKSVSPQNSKLLHTRVYPLSSADLPNRRPSTSKVVYSQVWLRCCLTLLAAICFLWTIWLILLTIAPNQTINLVMRTEKFDEGTFWLLVDTPPHLLWPTVIVFGLVVLGYFATIIQLFQPNNQRTRTPLESFDTMKSNIEKIVVNAATDRTSSRITSSAAKVVVSLTQAVSPQRQLVNVCLKVGDLVVEGVLLFGILEEGPPVLLVAIFTTIIISNAVSCITMMFLPSERTGLTETIVDVIFDFLIAVGYPIIVLIYCFSTFTFDHDKLAINLEVFPRGWFEQSASVIADPVQTNIIHKTLKLLRVANVMDMITRIGINVVFCFRLHRIASRVQQPKILISSVYPKRHLFATAILFIYVVSIIVFVEESIRTSAVACRPHPECVVKAHRWVMVGEGFFTQCPCLTLIDGDIAPKTYQEWMSPRNITDKVAQLAATGDLQTIQLINRYLPMLPDELRRCNKMTHLSLVYTHTATFPEWVQEFTKLQYLHLEGTAFASLVSLPEGMFDKMNSLAFIHLGIHPIIPWLPSFQGLTSLKSLVLALLFSLVELPSLDSLHSLEKFLITSLVTVDSLPDLTPLTALTSFEVVDRATWCCNGFLDVCNLKSPHCMVHPLWGTPAASCLAVNRSDDRPTQGTLKVLEKYSQSICGGLILPGTAEGPPTEKGMAQCNGTLYRRCEMPGHKEAMCYNARFMAISCTENPYPIEMRRRQIQQRVGDPCDPVHEAWLGCTSR